jgi:dipeptidyl-peptidase-4
VDILKVNTSTGAVSKLISETDNAWIETDGMTLEFLDDNSFLWASERSGFRHLYWFDAKGNLKKPVTKGNWEITDYITDLILKPKKFSFKLQKKEA